MTAGIFWGNGDSIFVRKTEVVCELDLFSGYKLIQSDDGYIVELYINRQFSEFAKDFDKSSEENESFEKKVRKYIQDNFSGLKVKTVKLMLGAMLIASFPIIAEEGSAAASAQAYTQASDSYTVQPGDTLYIIANKTGTTVTEIKSLNKLENDMIYPGQRLAIQKPTLYTVKPGDTLYIIAHRYGTDVNTIKTLNGLSTNVIHPGQRLKIPSGHGPVSQQQRVYTVQSGDTPHKIATRFNISTAQLKKYNRLTGDMIYPGQMIYIPGTELIKMVNSLPNTVMRVGDRGEHVRNIQKAFNQLNYVLSEDGVYDVGTQAVVRDFQSRHGSLATDGVYGPETRKYLQDALLSDHIIVTNPNSLLVLVNKKYALPKNYVPDDLVVPNVNFSFAEYDPKKLMRKDAAAALETMFRQARKENIPLYAVSGYRSYDRQEAIFTSKVIRSGMESAGQFSAKPGESEHQTGLAMDLTGPAVNYGLSQNFEQTKEGQWLKKNAHQFGFIIRYQKGKEHITGYQYEPWHVRYVGKPAAQVIYSEGLTLEEYLGK